MHLTTKKPKPPKFALRFIRRNDTDPPKRTIQDTSKKKVAIIFKKWVTSRRTRYGCAQHYIIRHTMIPKLYHNIYIEPRRFVTVWSRHYRRRVHSVEVVRFWAKIGHGPAELSISKCSKMLQSAPAIFAPKFNWFEYRARLSGRDALRTSRAEKVGISARFMGIAGDLACNPRLQNLISTWSYSPKKIVRAFRELFGETPCYHLSLVGENSRMLISFFCICVFFNPNRLSHLY